MAIQDRINDLKKRKQKLENDPEVKGRSRIARLEAVIDGLRNKKEEEATQEQGSQEGSSSPGQDSREETEYVGSDGGSKDRSGSEQESTGSSTFENLVPDQSAYETLQDKKELALSQDEDKGLPDDKERLEDLEEFVDGNPSAKNSFNNVEEAVESKRKAVEREEQVDNALSDIKDAPTREERLQQINNRLQEAKEIEKKENVNLDTSELKAHKERLQHSEGLYVIQEDGKEEVVNRNELEQELQQQKQGLQKNQEEIDQAFVKSNTTVSREKQVEKKAEEINLQKDFVETDSAYTETGNKILEAGKTATAYGETLTGARGTELLASTIPGGESPTDVVEKNIAEDLVTPGSPSPSEQAVDRLSSPPGMLAGFTGVGAGATKGIQAVTKISSTAGKSLGTVVAGAEAVEITRRGFKAGREFGQGDFEGGAKPLIKLGVEEAGARTGARAVTGSRSGDTRIVSKTDNTGNQVDEADFPTNDQLPRTDQNMEFEVGNTEDVVPTREDIAGTRDLEVLQAGNRREVAQETSQVQGRRRRADEGLEDPTQPLQRGGEENIFGSREDRIGLRNEEDELLSLNEEARSQTNLETSETTGSSNSQVGRSSEDPQIGNSDVVNEEGFKPEEAEVLAESEQAVGVSGVSETGGLEIQVQAVDDLGTLQRVDFGEVASDLAPGGTRKGQLQLQTEQSPAERFDITDDIELVGDAEDPGFEVSAQGEDFQVTRLDQVSREEVEALGVAPLEQETGTEEVVEPDTDADIEIESEIVQSEFNDVEEAEVSVVESFSEEENINEERPVVFQPEEGTSTSVGQGNQVGFREETGEIQDIQEEIVPQEEDVREEIPVGRAFGRNGFKQVRETRGRRRGFGRFEFNGREGREARGRPGFEVDTDLEDEGFSLDQEENVPGERREEEEFLPDLLSANTSELLFGSATFDVSADETATGRQFTVEQQENLEETENNFEVRF